MNPIETATLADNPAVTGATVSMLSLLVLAAVLIFAVYGEVKENRIPNWLTMSGAAAGLAIGYFSGDRLFWLHLGGLVIGFAFLFVFYLFGGIGGGDVKLMAAVGSLMGADLIKPTLFYTAAIGAFLAILLVVWRKDFWTRIAWTLRKLAFWQKQAGDQPAPPAAVVVPYGLAIAAGCLVTLLLN